MIEALSIFAQPEAWVALATLVVLEIVLGIDNLVFISILSNRLPKEQQAKARKIGITIALGLRLVLLLGLAWIVNLTTTVFDLGLTGPLSEHGEPVFETAFSWRDMIMVAGGLFLVWNATKEIHHSIDAHPTDELLDKKSSRAMTMGAAIAQIGLLNMVFSVDSILTAVGMSDDVPVMAAAIIISVGAMLLAAEPLARFVDNNPTVVMLALAFLMMIGVVLIADGFGVHVPKGYVYAAMAFSGGVETLNILARKRRERKAAKAGAPGQPIES
ncbi:MAG TPA: TerC family protein [Allosphingosinicella sp.]|nr:TerC family protein [Allosphingosinicella sp.]